MQWLWRSLEFVKERRDDQENASISTRSYDLSDAGSLRAARHAHPNHTSANGHSRSYASSCGHSGAYQHIHTPSNRHPGACGYSDTYPNIHTGAYCDSGASLGA